MTLAVLPFVDLSPGKDQEYFSDGLSEEILNQVAQVEGLKVAARTSSFAFKGKTGDMRIIGEELGVANLLEGSIRKDGNDLRITAQLINAKDGTHIWSQTYDREMSKIFALQEEIAKDVARALSIKLDVGEMRRAKGGTANVDAYNALLLANGAFGHGDFAHRNQYLREAVKLDPEFVAAWLAIFLTTGRDSPDHTEALNRLKALAPNSWQTNLARASALELDRSWFEAHNAYEGARAAVDTNNGRLSIDAYEAHFFTEVGDISAAERLWQPLAKDAKAFIPFPYWTQRHLLFLGRYSEALTELDRNKTLPGYPVDDDFEFVVNLRFGKNSNPSEIWSNYSGAVKKSPLLQSLFPVRTNPMGARAVLHRAFENPVAAEYDRSDRIVVWADFFGDKDLALAAMRQSLFDTHDFQVTQLWWPYSTNLRADPRFKDIVREIGMVDYWRRSGNWGDFCKPVGTDDFECH